MAVRESVVVFRLRFETGPGTAKENHISGAEYMEETVSREAANVDQTLTGVADHGHSLSLHGITGQGCHTEGESGALGQPGHSRLCLCDCLIKQHADRERT